MALRIVEVYLPSGYSGAEKWSEDHPVIAEWSVDLRGEGRLLRALLNSEDTEAFLEDIEKELGESTEYRILLLPVEATVPREQQEEAEEEQSEQKTTRINREELYEDVVESIRGGHVYLLMVVLSTVVAAGGMLRDDVAVVVGAMVIAPLIGPNIATALGVTLGDTSLLLRATRVNLLGLTVTLVLSFGIGAAIDFRPTVEQIASRTQVDFGALALALSAGVAGALSVTRGISTALIGVMVAVALLPPLVALGMLLGAQYYLPAYGAGLLLLINLASINLAAVLTFVLQGVRPSAWFEAEEAKKSTRIAVAVLMILLGILVAAIILSPTDLIPDAAKQ